MALIYNDYERDNKVPNAKTPRVAVAYTRQIRQVTTKELAEDISDRCTVHRADVYAVLDALSISATNYLVNGFGVKLGDLGSFSMRISCKAASTAEEFSQDLIKGAKIAFTPSKEILARVKQVSYVKGASLGESAPNPTDPALPSNPDSGETEALGTDTGGADGGADGGDAGGDY
ncbi:MAG: HU family DNA-binding protein [Porphyromonas sp.]|nr:HU family DNA-binding protein [Porphyromonas sp.]